MSLSDDMQAIPRLMGDAVEQLGKLVQNEAELARAEIAQKVKQAGMGAAYFGAAAIMLVPVVVVLLITLALWINHQLGLSPVLSHLIAAAAGALISLVLALIGMKQLKAENLTPKVTIEQVERDIAAAKRMVK